MNRCGFLKKTTQMKKYFLIIMLFLIIGSFGVLAQEPQQLQNEFEDYDQEQLWIKHKQGDKNVLKYEVIDGDSIPVVNLKPIAVIERRFKDAADRYAFMRLKRNIIKVMPYARKAVKLMNQIEEATNDMSRRRQKKKYIRALEDELKVEFEDQLKNLTVSQGKVLLKLVERESDRTTHDLIKNYKSGVSAFFWQQLGKRYGYDLKEGYAPDNHPDMELIISNLEATGQI